TAAPDGLPGQEGTFNMCSFWLVEALTRAGRTDPARLEDARLLFEQMLGYANHLGLFAEQTDTSGEALGNYPAGVHPPGLDQRRLQPRPGARDAVRLPRPRLASGRFARIQPIGRKAEFLRIQLQQSQRRRTPLTILSDHISPSTPSSSL